MDRSRKKSRAVYVRSNRRTAKTVASKLKANLHLREELVNKAERISHTDSFDKKRMQ
jgi:hypothetical protein